MKKFIVPLIEKEINVYVGHEEWPKYVEVSERHGADHPEKQKGKELEYPGKYSGRCTGSWVWVEDVNYAPTLIHEASHFVDEVLQDIGTNDGEMRAYITENIMTRVLTWAGLLNGDK